MGFSDAPFYRPTFALFQFSSKQRFQIFCVALLCFDCLTGQPDKL